MDDPHQSVISPLATGEDLLKIPLGFDGPHEKLVGNREPLAALGTTTGEDGAAALGGHTRAEAVALGTLALVRLVRTLHCNPSLGAK